MASHEDHYLWLTSLVSARHLDRAACRLIGATAFLSGIVPLLLIMVAAGPHDAVGVAVAAAIAVCTTIIGSVWVRRCWPTRTQSRVTALAGTVCVAAAVAVIPDPLVAALGATALVGPIGFTALFHARRQVVLTVAVGVLTVGVAGWRLAGTAPLLAVVVIPLVVVVNVFAGFAWLLVVHLAEAKVSSTWIDPLTGLLNRAGFTERMTAILGARDRAEDRHLVIVIISVDTHGLLHGLGRHAAADRASITAASQLRRAVRRDTILGYRGDGVFVLAELFTTADPAVLLERLRGTVTDRPAQLSASIGAVSTPLAPLTTHPVDDVLAELLPLAQRACHDARRTGGNTTRVTIDPTLDIHDENLDAAP